MQSQLTWMKMEQSWLNPDISENCLVWLLDSLSCASPAATSTCLWKRIINAPAVKQSTITVMSCPTARKTAWSWMNTWNRSILQSRDTSACLEVWVIFKFWVKERSLQFWNQLRHMYSVVKRQLTRGECRRRWNRISYAKMNKCHFQKSYLCSITCISSKRAMTLHCLFTFWSRFNQVLKL